MQVGIWPKTTVLRGFGGGSVSGVGDITLGISIDGVALNVDAIVLVYELFDINICWVSLYQGLHCYCDAKWCGELCLRLRI